MGCAQLRRPRAACLWGISGLLLGGCALRRVDISLLPPRIATVSVSAAPTPEVFWYEPFDVLDSARWREVEVRRHNQYRASELEGRRCLEASSRNSASILLSTVQVDPGAYAWLSWEWRVDTFVEGEALERKDGSDAAARVYVYFDTKGLPWQKRSLDYVWSKSLPVGTMMNSAFSPQSKIIIAESGETTGEWRKVSRNVRADYLRAFKGQAPDVIAIGVMNDADNSNGEALAYFDELTVSRQASPHTTP